MNEELMLKVLEKLLESGTPGASLAVAVGYFFVVRPFNRKLSGLSAYIKRFLVIQRQRARATSALAGSIERLCKHLEEE